MRATSTRSPNRGGCWAQLPGPSTSAAIAALATSDLRITALKIGERGTMTTSG